MNSDVRKYIDKVAREAMASLIIWDGSRHSGSHTMLTPEGVATLAKLSYTIAKAMHKEKEQEQC